MSALDQLTNDDFATVRRVLGGVREPDLTIAGEDGEPYLHRWYVIPRNEEANFYLHLQVRSDPERPLHDHPWDNQSVILSGGYDEVLQDVPPLGHIRTVSRRKGQTCSRRAEAAHRLILPEGVPYTLTLFSTGPNVRAWGFHRIPNHSRRRQVVRRPRLHHPHLGRREPLPRPSPLEDARSCLRTPAPAALSAATRRTSSTRRGASATPRTSPTRPWRRRRCVRPRAPSATPTWRWAAPTRTSARTHERYYPLDHPLPDALFGERDPPDAVGRKVGMDASRSTAPYVPSYDYCSDATDNADPDRSAVPECPSPYEPHFAGYPHSELLRIMSRITRPTKPSRRSHRRFPRARGTGRPCRWPPGAPGLLPRHPGVRG